jgi:putative transposase
MISRAHKIRLVPTKAQETALRKACGVARYTWNWALAEWDRQYKAGLKPTAFKLKKQWNQEKPEWVYESPKDANQQPFSFLGKAWNAFFKGTTGRPSFKKRGLQDNFYVSNDKFSVAGRRVRLPIIGLVKMREPLRFEGKIMSATVSCRAGRWYISIQVEMPELLRSSPSSAVGVDVGIKDIAVASDGSTCPNLRQLKHSQRQLRRAQRIVARRQKGSANRRKAIVKLQRIHERIVNRRNDAIHKFTSRLAKNHSLAVIETLEVAEMKENAPRYLRVLLQDTAMREVHRQLEYKLPTVKAPAKYASSKTCSACGFKKEILALSERTYRCEICGHEQDRDLNAANNLKKMRWATSCKPVDLPKAELKQEEVDAHLCALIS